MVVLKHDRFFLLGQILDAWVQALGSADWVHLELLLARIKCQNYLVDLYSVNFLVEDQTFLVVRDHVAQLVFEEIRGAP